MNKTALFTTLQLLLLLQLAVYACAVEFPQAKLTFEVVDENNVPIENAETMISTQGINLSKNKLDFIRFENVTDKNGLSPIVFNTLDIMYYKVAKQGFYSSDGEYKFKHKKAGHWEPWDPRVKVILRAIGNQVPMYARNIKMIIPKIGEPIGFDLIVCDWVSPYGKGNTADFIFKLDKKVVSRTDLDCAITVTFNSQHDGILQVKENIRFGSELKLPKIAPDDGYSNKIVLYMNRKPGEAMHTNIDDSNNYIFRIRSEVIDGKLIKSMYGKIYGDIYFAPLNYNTAAIYFEYLLNPDYSKNLEFDPKKNLFKNLGLFQRLNTY
ncbi:hypothetical protein GURASL_17040 [Geotalea uraniireducens]|uniref:Uncharacterized protein n=1 Tax=Geotalea uraniireducens TaxID=351604 RepID=A0ABM8EL77_9BACT|nr:hypothetical protein [Geotalea uraniireducens]BDV42781.1 hypothetical protein GURASL_17040 [Geotalea uraniireducens]